MSAGFCPGGRMIDGSGDPYVIAEIGINHDGVLDLAIESIDAAAAAGADAVKFQTFRAEEFMADRQRLYQWSTADGETRRESMYEMFKRLELPEAWHRTLFEHARRRGVDFLSSAADRASCDLLLSLPVPAIKIASEDLINLPLLEHVGRRRAPVVLSTGMADAAEIDRAVALLRDSGCTDLMLLHCVSIYPTPDAEANLRRMGALAERYAVPVGYSDHTIGVTAAVAATVLGAAIIEKHFTIDRSRPGPDHAFSADPAELRELVTAVRRARRQLGSAALEPAAGEAASRRDFRRSVVAASAIPAGAVITASMLELKRPGDGLPPDDLARLVGRRVRRPVAPHEPLSWSIIEQERERA